MCPEFPRRDLPVPLVPPEPSPPEEGILARLLKQRFLLVALVLLLFFGFLFGWGGIRGPQTPPAVTPTGPPAPAGKVAPPAPPAAKLHGAPLTPGTALTPGPAPAPVAQPHQESAPLPVPATKAAPHPAPEPSKPAVKGEVFTQALIKIMDEQLNKGLFGWRPNSIICGKMGLTDNVNNRQLGVLEVARRTVIVLNENFTRFAVTEAYNPQVNEAMNYFMVSPDKYWFPSASGKYREALADLKRYTADLSRGRSRFYTRVDNLITLLTTYKDILGSSFHNLIKETEADGRPVTWWYSDDYFYFSQGVALGMSQMLEAVKEEFHPEIQKKGSHKLLEDAIHALHTAAHLHPWMVTNGGKDGILANHRANMGTYIGEAEHLVATLQTVLATN